MKQKMAGSFKICQNKHVDSIHMLKRKCKKLRKIKEDKSVRKICNKICRQLKLPRI